MGEAVIVARSLHLPACLLTWGPTCRSRWRLVTSHATLLGLLSDRP